MSSLDKHFDGSYIAPWIIKPLHEDWGKVIPLGTPRRWPKKAIIHHIGCPNREIILIRTGLLKITALSRDGSQRSICILGPGSILGEASLFCGIENHHVVQAVEACGGIIFDKKTVYRDIIPKHHTLATALCQNLAVKSYIMSTQLECGAFMSCKEKIAHFLYHLAVEQGQNSETYRKISKLSLVSLSSLLGMHRVTTTNVVNSLKRHGIIDKKAGSLVVRNVPALLDILRAPH